MVASAWTGFGVLAAAIFDSTDALIIVVDDRQRIQVANPAAQWALLRGETDLTGRDAPTLIGGPRRGPELRQAFRAALRDGTRHRHEFDLPLDATTSGHSIAWSISRISSEPGALVCVGIDVTDVRSECERLRAQATTDELTGLPNRAALAEHLARFVSTGVWVLFCDLNGFKDVNDTLGHAAGDSVLVQIARRLTRTVRSESFVARFGGDEFVIVVGGDRDFNPQVLAARIIRATDQPLILPDGLVVTIGMSVGIAALNPGEDPAATLAYADQQMYAMKSRRTTRTSRATPSAAVG